MAAKERSLDRGVVLIEFLAIALGLLIITFAAFEFGRVMFTREYVGESARMAAHEAATKPGSLILPLDATEVYDDPGVFLEDFTVIDVNNLRFPDGSPLTDQNGDGNVDLTDQFMVLPPVHTLLRASMFSETRDINGTPRTIVRLPGVLLQNPAATFDLIVRVPEISGSDAALRRVINPPLDGDALLLNEGLARFECWEWNNVITYVPGLPAVPDPLNYSNVPAGFSVVTLDVNPNNPAGLTLKSYAIARKEIQ
jgi:hypothetical protein